MHGGETALNEHIDEDAAPASIPEGERRDISVHRQTDYLLVWLGGIGVERALFVGHDLGGGVLQTAATRHLSVSVDWSSPSRSQTPRGPSQA